MKRLLTFIGATALLAGPCFATSKLAGTSGAQFLKIGAGSRPTAMGEAFVAIADDVNAVYHNPAGLGLLKRPEFAAMHTQYFQGLNYDFGAYAHPLEHGAVAISACTLKTDDISRRGADESLTGSFTNQDAAYALSYGHALSETLAVGLTARWIREEIDNASAQAWSGDIGVLKRFDNPLSLGFAVRHLGTQVKFNDEGDPLPLTFDGGFGLRFFQEKLLLSGDIRQVRDAGLQFGTGAEWKQSLGEKFRYALRVGYNSAVTDANGANGISLGAGAGFRRFDLDFAWVPFGDLGNTFRYTAHMKF